MWPLLLNWVGGLLGGPFIRAALDAYKAKQATLVNHDTLAETLAAKELDVETREMELQTQLKIAQIGTWYAVENLFGYATLIFYAKVLLWDKAFHLGNTDALKGDVAEWAGLVILFFFGKRGIENALKIWKSK